jgi:hypothetical protein
LHVLASRKDIFAKFLDVPQEGAVVDSSLVDSVCWWIVEFVDIREEETTLYPDEMGINQERADWAELRKFFISNQLPLQPSFVRLSKDFECQCTDSVFEDLKQVAGQELFELDVMEFIMAEKQ